MTKATDERSVAMRKPVAIAIAIALALGFTACGQTAGNTQPDSKQESSQASLTSQPAGSSGSQQAAEQASDASNSAQVISKREGFSIREISDDLFDRMKAGNTYKEDCIVPREDLRYILALHKDKDGNVHQGEMVVHKLIAEDVLEILEKLYDANYPIERMVLPDNYMADDEIMMRDNNSASISASSLIRPGFQSTASEWR